MSARAELLRIVDKIEESEDPRRRRALANHLLRTIEPGITVELPCDEALRRTSQAALRQADAATPEFFLALYAMRDWVRSVHA